GGLLDFTDPHANHFGFLWLVGVALVAVLLPIYAVLIYRMRLVYVFDRTTNRFAHNGKQIAPLRRIESVRFSRHDDCDDRAIFRLAVVHSDGFTCELDEWYDEDELRAVAAAIADFTHTHVA